MIESLTERELIVQLHQADIFQFAGRKRGFAFKHHDADPNAPLAPDKIQFRHPWVYGRGLAPTNEVGRLLVAMIGRSELVYDHIAPIPQAGCRLYEAAAFDRAWEQNHGFVALGKEQTAAGRQIVLASDKGWRQGDRVLLLDDLISRGGTKVEAIQVLRDVGLVVEDLVVVIDREQGGVAQLAELGVAVHALWPWSEVLEALHQARAISRKQFRNSTSYLAQERNLVNR